MIGAPPFGRGSEGDQCHQRMHFRPVGYIRIITGILDHETARLVRRKRLTMQLKGGADSGREINGDLGNEGLIHQHQQPRLWRLQRRRLRWCIRIAGAFSYHPRQKQMPEMQRDKRERDPDADQHADQLRTEVMVDGDNSGGNHRGHGRFEDRYLDHAPRQLR